MDVRSNYWFFAGIYKERNDIKWKENREVLQCAYACCEELKRSIIKNLPIDTILIKDLKYNKWFNIKNKNIRDKVFNIIEFGIVDSNTSMYIDNKKTELVAQIDTVLPILLNELK